MQISIPRHAVKAFAEPHESLGDLGAEVAASLIAAAADIALVVDSDGSHQGRFLRHRGSARGGLPGMARPPLGRYRHGGEPRRSRNCWPRPLKIGVALAAGEPSLPQGRRPSCALFGMSLGRDGQIVAVGRDLRSTAALQQRLANAQQTMEREYERIRSAETRYRLLFQLAAEPVLSSMPLPRRSRRPIPPRSS